MALSQGERRKNTLRNGEWGIAIWERWSTGFSSDHVADDRKTVGHQELRAWMEEEYPQQRPAFLLITLAPGPWSGPVGPERLWKNLERMAAEAIEDFPAWEIGK